MPEGVVIVVLIATIAAAIGIGFGIVIAPRLGRAVDRIDPEEQKPGDGPD